MKRILLVIPFLLLVGFSYGQNYRDEDVKLRKFDEKKWKEIVNGQTFTEDPPKKIEPPDLGKSWFNFLAMRPELLRAISFALVFALFAFVLYYVSMNTSFTKRIKREKFVSAAAPVDNIEELDIDALLRDAIASGDLRLAIRVHYLLLLKKLNEAGLIAWKKDKTNRDYLSELYGRNACYDDVRLLTLAYELVWYGERDVSQDSFQRLSGNFESVGRQVAVTQSGS